MSSPTIKILISCHKEVVTPSSDVFLPVHVGAEQASMPIEGYQPDNIGDNISDRNFTFCELTAQYWAWKNLDADYYGLCHYRRYFCFDGKKHHSNDHKQIEVKNLSPCSLKEYRLDDAELIRSKVTQHDIITPPYWNVKRAPTLDGPKKTIKEHMMGYGLIDEQGFSLLEQITAEKQPEFLEDLKAYLQGHQYLGYNCFIMKKEAFYQLCEFEFSIILEFDKRFNYDNRTTTQKRVCGYLGEILYSVFINHIRKTKAFNIAQYPMVFFEDTKPRLSLDAPAAKSPSISVVWRYQYKSPEALAVALTSFFNHADRKTTYKITLLCNPNFLFWRTQRLLPETPDNIHIEQTNWANIDLSSTNTHFSESELSFLTPFILPWLTNNDAPLLWLDGLMLFTQDPASLFEDLNDVGYSCAQSITAEREINLPSNRAVASTYHHYANSHLTLGPSVMAMNPQVVKANIQLQYVIDSFREIITAFDVSLTPQKKVRKFPEEMPASALAAQSILLEKLSARAFSFSQATESVNFEITQSWANEGTFRNWNSCGSSAVVIHYRAENIPYIFPDVIYSPLFWQAARDTKAYELLLETMIKKKQNGLRDILFPEETLRRKAVRKLITMLRH